jgi:hypothetical protein
MVEEGRSIKISEFFCAVLVVLLTAFVAGFFFHNSSFF